LLLSLHHAHQQAAEKEKDKQVDDAWRKMSEFEKMVMDLKAVHAS
jgi:hypothetical protein